MEKAHAPIAGAKAVGTDEVVGLISVTIRRDIRFAVVATQRFGRRYDPRRQGGRVENRIDVDVSGPGEGHRPFVGAAHRHQLVGFPGRVPSGRGCS